MKIRNIRYGGSTCDSQEEKAIMKVVKASIKSGGWQAGPEAKKMEEEASKTLGVGYGILSTSGTCAGILALEALELKKGSEIIICTITFPTIANMIVQQGFVPVFVDGKVGTYAMDVKEVEKAITDKTGAIIAIHPLGSPVDMPALMKMVEKANRMRAQGLAKYERKYNQQKISVIEDCCDTWGGSINGKMLGSFGDISFTSFHAAHIVSMGVGGGTFTSNKLYAERIRQYRDWGRQAETNKPHQVPTLPKDYNPRFVYDKLGYNFQILELQAAMGRIQLRKAKAIKAKRTKNYEYLVKHLSKFDDLIMPTPLKGSDVCWFALPLTTTGKRGPLVAHLEANGIETRSMFAGNMTRHPSFKGVKYKIGPAGLEESDYILEHSFWIGVHPRMTKEDLEYVVKIFEDYYAKTS